MFHEPLKAYVHSIITRDSRWAQVSSRERELESRVEVELEKFTKKVQIEARVLGDLAINHIVPDCCQPI
ncbi:MAG: hypothetical protein MZV63_52600 [Marinilabiliales bacterium]|nr:hypothetical protein [Marinilabiliales bacterium]